MKNFKNIGSVLSRNEMRSVYAGRLDGGGEVGDGECKDACQNNSDCNCNACPPGSGGGTQTCGTIHCAGTNSMAKKVCTCWQG